MDHQLGRSDFIRWQGRKNRRAKGGVLPLVVILVICAVVGAVSLVAQAGGWLVLPGPLAAGPAILLLVALAAPVIALARAALMWLAG